jgi:SAM-dependent methyltransferase
VTELLPTARRVGRRTGRTFVRLARAANPLDRLPGAKSRYRNTWTDPDVAGQMLALTNSQLEHADDVAPYRSFHELLGVLLDDERLPRPATFLDIGCGMGAYGELLERWAPGRFAYTGADYAEAVVATAQERWPERRFVRRDVHEPHALDGFDVVFASALLDVLADYETVLDALCAADAPWVILHRQRIGKRERVEVVPGYRGQRTYRSTLTLEHLASVAGRHGRGITARVPVEGDVHSFVLAR